MKKETLEAKIAELQKENEALKNRQNLADKFYKESQELAPYQAEMIKLQKHIEKHDKKLIILFEGRDAAGKGSLIGTISQYMNPTHYRIVALGRPTEIHKTQWYFQKYVEHFPSARQIILFDRSWYNRAMVEPVFGFCTPYEHEVFMRDVIGFEQSLVHHNITLIKLYLSVKKSVQAQRFEQRRNDPLRSWKLSEIDLQSQMMWDDFSKMKYNMLSKTNHADAKWNVIRSSQKHQARIEAMKLILNHFDYEDRDNSLSFKPEKGIIIPLEDELTMMRETRKDLKFD